MQTLKENASDSSLLADKFLLSKLKEKRLTKKAENDFFGGEILKKDGKKVIIDVTQKNTLYEKILCVPERDDKYFGLPITPGVNFIKRMFSHDDAERAVPSLKINIPETYWFDTETFYIYNGELSFYIRSK